MKWTTLPALTAAVCFSAMPVLAQDKPDHAAKKERLAQKVEMHKKLLADLKQDNDELQKLVTEMNSAQGEAKVAATAATVSKLAAIFQENVQRMEKFHEKMAERLKKHEEKQSGGAVQ